MPGEPLWFSSRQIHDESSILRKLVQEEWTEREPRGSEGNKDTVSLVI